MNKVIPTPLFEVKFKRFSKKFPSLFDEIQALESKLVENPRLGVSLGYNLFKIRLASKDKGKGKSGGFRIITYLIFETGNSTEIYLITIYDKSEESSIKKSDLTQIVKHTFPE